MLYNEHGWPGSGPGPVVSSGWMTKVVSYTITKMPAEKVVAAISVFGFDFDLTTGKNTYASYQIASDLAKKYNKTIIFDQATLTPMFDYTDEQGNKHEVWFENQDSIVAKITLAIIFQATNEVKISKHDITYESYDTFPVAKQTSYYYNNIKPMLDELRKRPTKTNYPTYNAYDLTEVSNVSKKRLDEILSKYNLESISDTLIHCEEYYHVNCLFVLGIIFQESGYGTSERANDGSNNLTGHAVYNNVSRGSQFDSYDDCVENTFKLLAYDYLNENGKYFNGKSIWNVNEMYSKDISKKVRSAIRAKKQNGEFLSNRAPCELMLATRTHDSNVRVAPKRGSQHRRHRREVDVRRDDDVTRALGRGNGRGSVRRRHENSLALDGFAGEFAR
jgi:beta-N-acetylglucosaminidase